ncbi:hypothetical protein ABIC12_002988 [Pantoea agglomerans]|nr:hypothetical protein [Pantoea agglomerans]
MATLAGFLLTTILADGINFRLKNWSNPVRK